MYGGLGLTPVRRGPKPRMRGGRYGWSGPPRREMAVRGLGATGSPIFDKCMGGERGKCIRRWGNTLQGYACTMKSVAPCYAYAVRRQGRSPALAPRLSAEQVKGLGEYFAGMGAEAADAAAAAPVASPAPMQALADSMMFFSLAAAVGAVGALGLYIVLKR